MIRYFIVVCGSVQGVGFRYFAYCTANSLNLTGWVRNCMNGNVEMEVQGYKDTIENFISRIKQGNGYSDVDDMSIKKIDTLQNEKKFKISGWW